ncbi:MAG: GGDEF domain-containing protein, partial [Actinobacteria bacterium]|nr:GGDEF domain-containing protein [Actinomycetota bacterium]
MRAAGFAGDRAKAAFGERPPAIIHSFSGPVDYAAEVQAKSELRFLAEFDPVTGLRSRTAITALLQEELASATMLDGKVAVMFVDLTQFLVVNRTLGYAAGDQVLADIARKVVAAVPDTYLVGRFDGHSLLVVVPDTQAG